jgi:hypothetical protein
MLKLEDIRIILDHLANAPTTLGHALQKSAPAVQKLMSIQTAVARGYAVELVTREEANILAEFRGKAEQAATTLASADTITD